MSPAIASGSLRRGWSPEELVDELGRVHAREFARLLCRAALLRTSVRRDLGLALRALRLETDHACWRREALRARELAELDGFELAGLLRHALARPVAQWADAEALVQAALALDVSEETRWHAAAQGWFARRGSARARLYELARSAASELWRARARWLLDGTQPGAARIRALARGEQRWSS